MSSLKNKRPFLIAIGIAILATFLLAWYILIPRAALINLPYRWGNAPLGVKRSVVQQVLGIPPQANESAILTTGDEWQAFRTNGNYTLHIYYNSDTIADASQIYFTYRLGFLQKRYLIKADTKR